jgi:hypothetical protein
VVEQSIRTIWAARVVLPWTRRGVSSGASDSVTSTGEVPLNRTTTGLSNAQPATVATKAASASPAGRDTMDHD